ncbi:MAG: efflux RND transporter periplasmic adaptor subunit [Bdellovibrionales bacterium]|nr:efflux RND transporter periplasmic adaptor subunit [Bdellovibrionales bacterium]
MKRLGMFLVGGSLVLGIGWFVRSLLSPQQVAVTQPVRGPAVEAVYATGTVEGTIMLPIAPRTSGRLLALEADEGDSVKEGQVLARLEAEDLEQTVSELKAREGFAQEEFERQKLLLEKRATPREAFERARAELTAATAARKAAQAQVDYMTLYAPSSGDIIRRDGEIGELIPANQPVFWLVCCAPLRVTAEVDEEDIARVEAGQPVLIRADAFPGRTFDGTVQQVTPKGDPVARSYRVRISLDEETPLMIGMTAENNIILRKTEDAMLVPSSAVLRDAVWTVIDGKLHRQEVTVGARGTERTEILSGLKMDALVVTQPVSEFEEGVVVTPNRSSK